MYGSGFERCVFRLRTPPFCSFLCAVPLNSPVIHLTAKKKVRQSITTYQTHYVDNKKKKPDAAPQALLSLYFKKSLIEQFNLISEHTGRRRQHIAHIAPN